MALTPEDIINKEFTSPKGFGRSGYDMLQVDDFLDEVVTEVKRLNAENEALATKLKDCQEGKPSAGAPATTAPAAKPEAEAPTASKINGVPGKDSRESSDNDCAHKLEQANAEKAKLEAELKAANEKVAQLQRDLEAAKAGAQTAAGDKSVAGATAAQTDAAGVIALAQRLHDEYVHEGETKRDKLIADAQEHHDRTVGEANAKRDELISAGQSRHDELVQTGQAKHDELIGTAEKRRDQLSGDIDHLRQYHDSYRAHLREFMSAQLKGLDRTPLDEFDDPKAKNHEG